MEILRQKTLETAMVLQDVDMKPVEKTVEILKKAKQEGKTVFTFGNGGSHCNAEHFATDLFKACGIKAICLSGMTALSLAYMNDIAANSMFVEMAVPLYKEGDIFIAFSCSGNSHNVASLLYGYRSREAILFTGSGNGEAEKYADTVIKIPHKEIRIQESCHSVLCHVIIDALLHED